MNEKKYTFSFMEDISIDSRIYSCCSFEENAAYAIQSFDSLFTQFTPPTTLSVENMTVSKDKQRDEIINSLSLHSIQNQMNTDKNTENQHVPTEVLQQLNPEENLVFQSIQNHFPTIIPDLISSYTNYQNYFQQDITVNLPKLDIPIQYYEKCKDIEVDNSSGYIDLIEIDCKNERIYIPADFSLAEFATYYYSHILKIDCEKYMFYIKGSTFIPYDDDDDVETIDLKDPQNSFSQVLLNWLKQKKPDLDSSCFNTFNASKIKLKNLPIQFHQPYLLMLQQNSLFLEVHFSIRNYIHYYSNPSNSPISFEFYNTSLPKNYFPLVIYKKNIQKPACSVCKKEVASFVVSNDVLSAASPMFYCSSCLRRLHYDEKGKLISPPFSMQSF